MRFGVLLLRRSYAPDLLTGRSKGHELLILSTAELLLSAGARRRSAGGTQRSQSSRRAGQLEAHIGRRHLSSPQMATAVKLTRLCRASHSRVYAKFKTMRSEVGGPRRSGRWSATGLHIVRGPRGRREGGRGPEIAASWVPDHRPVRGQPPSSLDRLRRRGESFRRPHGRARGR
jgi:hypothetical protein